MSGTAPTPGYEGLEHVRTLLAQLTTALEPLRVACVLGTKADAEATAEPRVVWYEAEDDFWTFESLAIQPDDGDAVAGYREHWKVACYAPNRSTLRKLVFAIYAKLIDLLGELACVVKAGKPGIKADGARGALTYSTLDVSLGGPVYREYWGSKIPTTITVDAPDLPAVQVIT